MMIDEEEFTAAHKALRADLKISHHALRVEMKLRDAAMERIIAYGDQRNEQLILSFSQKFGDTIELRGRLARLEAQRAPQ